MGDDNPIEQEIICINSYNDRLFECFKIVINKKLRNSIDFHWGEKITFKGTFESDFLYSRVLLYSVSFSSVLYFFKNNLRHFF